MTESKARLRAYKGYTLIDAGPEVLGDPRSKHVLQVYDGRNNLVHSLLFESVIPVAVNKAIEQAKVLIDETIAAGAESEQLKSERYSDADLQVFKNLLLDKVIIGQNESIRLEKVSQAQDGPERVETEASLEKQNRYLETLNAAIKRIDEGTYGICKVTGKLISKDRLLQVPYATMSEEGKAIASGTAPKELPPVETKKARKPREKKDKQFLVARKCRVCGCTEYDCRQCIEKTGEACHWVEQDLCSACQEPTAIPMDEEVATDVIPGDDPEIKVTDTRASTLPSEQSTQTPKEIIMDFFKQLAATGTVDLTMRIMQKNDKMSVSLFPSGKSKMQPIVVTGTPEELDEEFFKSIQPAFKEINGITHNIEEAKKIAAENRESKAKKATKKSTPKKKSVSKPPAKKKAASKPKPKPKPKPKAKRPTGQRKAAAALAEDLRGKSIEETEIVESDQEESLAEETATTE
jgi:DnaK suppressor protein